MKIAPLHAAAFVVTSLIAGTVATSMHTKWSHAASPCPFTAAAAASLARTGGAGEAARRLGMDKQVVTELERFDDPADFGPRVEILREHLREFPVRLSADNPREEADAFVGEFRVENDLGEQTAPDAETMQLLHRRVGGLVHAWLNSEPAPYLRELFDDGFVAYASTLAGDRGEPPEVQVQNYWKRLRPGGTHIRAVVGTGFIRMTPHANIPVPFKFSEHLSSLTGGSSSTNSLLDSPRILSDATANGPVTVAEVILYVERAGEPLEVFPVALLLWHDEKNSIWVPQALMTVPINRNTDGAQPLLFY